MRKFLFVAFALFFASVQSQNIGLHFGVNSSNQLDKDVVQNNSKELNYKSVFGLNIGLDIKASLSNKLYFLTGLSFYQNGFKNDQLELPNVNYIAKSATLNYLKAPLNLLIDNKEKNQGFNLRFGGYVSYLIGGNYDAPDFPSEILLKNQFQNFDWGLSIGTGYKINSFTIDLGFDFGLFNIAAKTENHKINETVIKNRSLNLKLFYWIN